MTYRQLAQVYDFLMKDAPYDQWVNFTEFFIDRKRSTAQTSILDLGCGTGQVTWRLAEKGYQMTGVDLSEAMLTEASALALEKNLHVQWLRQDITELEGLAGFDLVTSYCDVINYITDETKLSQTFEQVYQALNEKGLFLFDVHSLDYVEDGLVDQVFSEVYDDLAYIWFCNPGDHQGEMHHELSFFFEENGSYQRFDEHHHQRTFPLTTYLNVLRCAGFNTIQVYADFGTESIVDLNPAPSARRLFFACQKS